MVVSKMWGAVECAKTNFAFNAALVLIHVNVQSGGGGGT